MNELLKIDLSKVFTYELLSSLLIIIALNVIIFFGGKLVSFIIIRILKDKISNQVKLIIKKVILYISITAILFLTLAKLNIDTTPFLGAAGIIGIAVGIASQASVSNIVSGFFLISEKAFEVGDIIQIGSASGLVLSIDLLSIKIKTFDNKFIRIPNENIIKTELINITRFPIRRLNVEFTISMKTDMEKVREILKKVTEKNTFCLSEPEPITILKRFGPYGLEILLGVWFEKTDFVVKQNSIMLDLKEAFNREGIEIVTFLPLKMSDAHHAPFPINVKEGLLKK